MAMLSLCNALLSFGQQTFLDFFNGFLFPLARLQCSIGYEHCKWILTRENKSKLAQEANIGDTERE